MYRRTKPFLNGIVCFKVNYDMDHPDECNPCNYGITYENDDCLANHPFQQKQVVLMVLLAK
jgi:hypothetical protein